MMRTYPLPTVVSKIDKEGNPILTVRFPMDAGSDPIQIDAPDADDWPIADFNLAYPVAGYTQCAPPGDQRIIRRTPRLIPRVAFSLSF
ncbi:MAG TPA: hypothetical protein VNO70_21170 [Blastocatellia bacterium]|nr:hypothetical protein [Blastocatellia bacterium]